MTAIEDELMEVDDISVKRKRKSFDEDLFAHGKRVKFQSFPTATAKLSVSTVPTTLTEEENNEECKF